MKAIDTPNDTHGHSAALRGQGIEAVGLYLRSDRSSKAMVDELAAAGIKRFSVWERGYPTSAGYFTEAQGQLDGLNARQFAESIGQPHGSPLFFAVDYDADDRDLPAIRAYFAAAQAAVKAAGFLCSVYGSGLVCDTLTRAGLAHSGWLAQSHGWQGYTAYVVHAAIIQGPETTLLGLDIDWDRVIDPAVCW